MPWHSTWPERWDRPLAGLLIAFIGAHGSYYTQAAMFVLATLWTVQMAMPERSPESAAARREPFMRSIVAGLAFVAQDRDIRTLMILAHGPLTLGMPYMSLMPIFAKDVLHGGAQLQGFLLTIIGIGSVLGALGVASMRRRYSYGLLGGHWGAGLRCHALGFCLGA